MSFATVVLRGRFCLGTRDTGDEERPDNTENRLLELSAFPDAAQHYNNTCARRKLAWSLCRATSRWTSFSCPWRIDPKVKKRTEDSKFLPPVDGGFGYNANFLTFDDRDTPLGRLGGGVLRRQGFVV